MRLTTADYHDMASQAGLEWLGEEIPRNGSTYTIWECSAGHITSIKYNVVQQGGECKECIKEAEMLQRVKTHLNYAAKYGFAWDDTQRPKNVVSKTLWVCLKCGYSWETSLNNLLTRNKTCINCRGKAHKTSRDYNDLATSRGFLWVGPLPGRTSSKTGWQCANNHNVWYSTLIQIKAGAKCPHCVKHNKNKKGDNQ